MSDGPATTPMDVSELMPCAVCGKGVMHQGVPVFYELTIRSVVADISNIRRMHGMEQVMGGNVPLARIFLPSNKVGDRLPANRVLLCADCAGESQLLLRFLGE